MNNTVITKYDIVNDYIVRNDYDLKRFPNEKHINLSIILIFKLF